MERHYLFSGHESPDEIKRILIDNSEGCEEKTYLVKLSQEQMHERRRDYIENRMKMAEHNEELKAAKDLHKVQTKPLIEEGSAMMKTLRTQHEEIQGNVYKMPDHKNGVMDFVNELGEVVDSRRLRPEEKQGNVFAMGKAVNE